LTGDRAEPEVEAMFLELGLYGHIVAQQFIPDGTWFLVARDLDCAEQQFGS